MVLENNIIVINFNPSEENKSWEKREAHKVVRKEYKQSNIYIRELKNRDYVSGTKVEEQKEKKNKEKLITDDLDNIKLFLEHEEKRSSNFTNEIAKHKSLMNLLTLKTIVKENADFYPSAGEVEWVLQEIDRIYNEIKSKKISIPIKPNVTTTLSNEIEKTQIMTRLENPRIRAIKLYLTELEDLIRQNKINSIDVKVVEANFNRIDKDITKYSFLYKYESNLVKQRLRMKYIKEALLLESIPSEYKEPQEIVDFEKFAQIRVTETIKDNYKIGQLLDFRTSLITLYVDININYYKYCVNDKLLDYQLEVKRIIRELSLVIDQFPKQKTFRALKIIDYIKTIRLIKKSRLLKDYMYAYLAHNIKLIRNDLTNKEYLYKPCDGVKSLIEQIDNLDKAMLDKYNAFYNVTFRNAEFAITKCNELCFKKAKSVQKVSTALNNLNNNRVKLNEKLSLYGKALPISDYIKKIDSLIEILNQNRKELIGKEVSNVQENSKERKVVTIETVQSDRIKKIIAYTKQIRYMFLHYAIVDTNKSQIVTNLNLILKDFVDNKGQYSSKDGIKSISIHTSELLSKVSAEPPSYYFTDRYVKVCSYIGKIQAIPDLSKVTKEDATSIKQNLDRILEDIENSQSDYVNNSDIAKQNNGSEYFNYKLYIYNFTKYINLLITKLDNGKNSSSNKACKQKTDNKEEIKDKINNITPSERIKKVLMYNRQVRFLLKQELFTENSKINIINNLNIIYKDLDENPSKYPSNYSLKPIMQHTIDLVTKIMDFKPTKFYTERNIIVCSYIAKVHETLKMGEIKEEEKQLMKYNLNLILKDIKESKNDYSIDDNINQRKGIINQCLKLL